MEIGPSACAKVQLFERDVPWLCGKLSILQLTPYTGTIQRVPAKRFNSPKEKFTGCAGRTVLETVNVTTYELLYIYALWHPYT